MTYTKTKRIAMLLAVIALLLHAACAIAEYTVLPPLRITEIMASNKSTLKDAFGQYSDWIEIHNEGSEPVLLDDVALSDKNGKLDKYLFRQGIYLQPDEYIIVFASGLTKEFEDEYHAPFKLSKNGEAVFLSIGGHVIDSVIFGAQETDVSLALDEDGVYKTTTTPTPGGVNIISPNLH